MKRLASAVAFFACIVSPTLAQQPTAGNLEKLSEFKTTGAPMEIPHIAQTGTKAEAIKKSLARIKLPSGFKIGLYAIVPDARHMAVGPQGVVVFVGTRKSKVWSVTDRDKDRVADEVKEFAPSIGFTVPNGVCFSKDGFLFLAEQNRVLVFPAAEFFYEGPDVAAFVVVKQGELIPRKRNRTTIRRAYAAWGLTTSSTSRSASRSTSTRRRRWTHTNAPASAASSA